MLNLGIETDNPCGVDEAGRGPLAGPVVAAAVLLDPHWPINGLADSKLLSANKREQLAQLIRTHALSWAVAEASVEEIDTLNILQASLLAMRRAIDALSVAPAYVLIDGNQLPRGLRQPAQAVVGGDRIVPAISAASILAKTARDAMLDRLHDDYPLYGFNRHRGYPTAVHLRALREHGPCAAHRRSYAPVAAALRLAAVAGV